MWTVNCVGIDSQRTLVGKPKVLFVIIMNQHDKKMPKQRCQMPTVHRKMINMPKIIPKKMLEMPKMTPTKMPKMSKMTPTKMPKMSKKKPTKMLKMSQKMLKMSKKMSKMMGSRTLKILNKNMHKQKHKMLGKMSMFATGGST